MSLDSAALPPHIRAALQRGAALRQPNAHHPTNHPRQAPEPQCTARHDPLAAAQAQGGDRDRFLVRIVSVRKRLLDEDNLVSKYHTDLLRYAGILPSDAPGVCKIETRQRKAAKGEAEKVEIEITRP